VRSRLTLTSTLIVVAVFLAVSYAVYSNRYVLLDWWYLRSYHPSSQVATLADQATMTATGRRLFYRADPQIVTTRAAMLRYCSVTDKQIAELGCYLSTEHIYLLQISDPALKNEMITTAGYEMLHSAYQRMGTAERRRMDARMEQVAAHITDPDILSQMEIYAKTEPGARDDELYSVLGTEYAQLPPDLEAHYATYFSHRQKLVAYNQQFNRIFNDLHTQIVQLDASIQASKTRMQIYLAAGEISRYNDLVPGVNQQIKTYNQQVGQYNQYSHEVLGTEAAPASK
jgi:hypothetical protein